MNMDKLAALALEQAISITGESKHSKHTQEVAFKLACMAMAEEKSA